MVDPRMAQATAVHTKIAMIAAIRLIMVVCVSTLSAAPATYLSRLVLSSTFHCKVKAARGSSLLHVGADFSPPSLLPPPIALNPAPSFRTDQADAFYSRFAPAKRSACAERNLS